MSPGLGRSLASVTVGGLLITGAATAGAQVPRCQSQGRDAGTIQLTTSQTQTVAGVPPQAHAVFTLDAQGGRTTDRLPAPSAGKWTLSESDVATLTAGEAVRDTIEFADGQGNALCRQQFNVTAAPTPDAQPSGGGLPTTGIVGRAFSSPTDCARAGADWESELAHRAGQQAGRFTELVFLEGGEADASNICYYNRDYGVVGDPVYVAVFTRGAVTWQSAHFEPCALQSAAPNVLQSTDRFPTSTQAAKWQIQVFPERRCYNTSVEVSIVGQRPNPTTNVTQRYALQQYDRYRATVQLGTLFTSQHDRDFALRPNPADTGTHFIYNKGPTNTGPEYVASLVLYSVLRYIPGLSSGAGNGAGGYPGRDVIHDQGLLERVSAVLGVGIRNPTKRFVAGAGVELLYGVSVLAGYDFAQVTTLADSVSMTQPFRGAATDIPTKNVWHRRGTLGISIDLRYATELFSAHR